MSIRWLIPSAVAAREPAMVADARARLEAAADRAGRPVPPITASMLAAVTGDPTLPDLSRVVVSVASGDWFRQAE